MITAYSKGVDVSTGSAIPFNVVKIDKGETATLKGASLNLNACGVYTIMGEFCVSSTTAAEVTVQLYQDGVALPETEMAVSIPANSYGFVAFVTDVAKSDNNFNNCLCTKPTVLQVIATISGESVEEVTFETAVLKEFRVIGR